jgi:phenylpyruvate tautomerase PptA (4-oxalocrotonate tautomerase family)
MPRLRDGYRQLATQLPIEVVSGLERLAEANNRSLVDELTHAARRHLAAPPTVRVVIEEPALPRAMVEREAPEPEPVPKKRGRPKKT